MKLTIGIPIYNNKKDLEDCLWSIGKNVTLETELIFVDDASTQDIEELAVRFASLNYRHIASVQYIRNSTNRGFAHNANIILDHSQGEIICILNSDTYVTPMALERIVEALEVSPQALIAGPSTSNANSIQAIYEYGKNTRISEEEILKNAAEVEKRFEH